MIDRRYVKVEVFRKRPKQEAILICSRIYNINNEETCKLLQKDIKQIPDDEIWIITRDKETNL